MLGQPVGASTWLTFTAIDGLRVSLGGPRIVTLREKAGPALGHFSDATGNAHEGLAIFALFPEWRSGQFIKFLYGKI